MKGEPTIPSVVFSVRTTDGKFISELSIPVVSTPAEYEPVVAAWLQLMHAALKAHPAIAKPEVPHAD